MEPWSDPELLYQPNLEYPSFGTLWMYPDHRQTHICKSENEVFYAVLPFKSRLDRGCAEQLLPEGAAAADAAWPAGPAPITQFF